MKPIKIVIIATILFVTTLFRAQSQMAIPIPDTLSGHIIILNMHQDSVQFFPGKKTQTLAFNQYTYLGPTLILNKGQNVSITVIIK